MSRFLPQTDISELMLGGKHFKKKVNLEIDTIYFICYTSVAMNINDQTQRNSSCLMKVALLCLVVLLSPAQAGLIITIAPNQHGNALMLVTGSGSTTSTTAGTWDETGTSEFFPVPPSNPFNSFFENGLSSTTYTDQNFEIDGFQVTAGTQTRSLNFFIFDHHDTLGDGFSLGFGDGTAGTTWDTDGVGVGAITVIESPWQTIRFRDTTTFTNSPGEALVFTDNFNVGTYTFTDSDNVFWGGSNRDGITLVISGDVIPEPTSALLLLLPATALLKRKRFC